MAILSQKTFSTHSSLIFLVGEARLKELGIKIVYDLRSDTEIEKYKTPCPTIESIDVIRTPVFKLEDYSPEMMAKCVSVVCPEC
jgi:hypothetical protein